MSTSVDNRVVQMQFDNAQFESGVQKSLDTLTRLDAALNDLENAGGFQGLSKTISGIGDDFEETFSFRGVAALTTFQRMAESVIDKVVGLFRGLKNNYMPVNFIDQAISGGKSRASNIENAKFRLEGLQVAWDNVYQDIDHGVKDTAYGLDSAAKAASILVGQGMQYGTYIKDGVTYTSELGRTLRGISGVAAMTNSSYDEIAEIFEKIGSKGKVQAREAGMLTARAFPVYSQLADYFNGVTEGSIEASEYVKASVKSITQGAKVTEADFDELSRKGKIDSHVFFEAMDTMFGDHAKKANETYAGSLSNVNAALSRIGADYQGGFSTAAGNVQGHMDNMIEVFNSLRVAIDYVRAALQPVTKGFLEFEHVFTHALAEFFNNGTGEKIDSMISPFRNLLNMLKSVTGAVGEAFRTAFPSATIENFTNVFAKINEFIASLWVPESTLTSIRGIFTGILSVISVIVDAIKGAIYVISPFFNVLNYAAALVLAVFGKVGDAIGFFRGELGKNEELKTFAGLLHYIAEIISNAFVYALTAAIIVVQNFELALQLLGLAARAIATVALAPLVLLFEALPKPIQHLIESVGTGFKGLLFYLTRFKDAVVAAFTGEGGGLLAALGVVVQGILNIPNTIRKAFARTIAIAKNEFDGLIPDSLLEKLSQAKTYAQGFGETLLNALQNIDIFGIASGFGQITERITAAFSNIKNAFIEGGFTGMLSAIKDNMRALPGMLLNTLGPIGTQISTIFTTKLDAAKEGWRSFVAAIKEGGVGSAFDFITAKIGTFGTTFKSIFDNINGNFILDGLLKKLLLVRSYAIGFGSTLMNSLRSVDTFHILFGFEKLIEYAGRFKNSLIEAFQSGGLAQAQTVFNRGLYFLKDTVAMAFGDTIKEVQYRLHMLRDTIISVQDGIRTIVGNFITNVFGALGNKFPFVNNLINVFQQLKVKIKTAFNSVKEQLKGFVDSMYQAGKDAIAGLAKGFLDNGIVQTIYGAIKAIIGSKEGGGILGFLANLVGWHSPWTIMIAAGAAAILGLAVGMMQSGPIQMVKNAILFVVNTIKQLLQPLINFLKPFGQLVSKYLTFENLNTAATVVGTALANLTNTLITFVTKIGTGVIGKIIAIKNGIVEFFKSLSGEEGFSMAGVAEKLGGPFKVIYSGLILVKGFVGKIFDLIGNANFGKFGEAIQTALGITELVGVPATIIIFATFTTLVAHGILKLVRSFGGLTSNIGRLVNVFTGFTKAFQLNAEMNAFRKIIISVAALVGVMAYAMYTIGSLPAENFNQAMQVLDRIFFFVGTLAVFLGGLIVFTQFSSAGRIGSIKNNLQEATKTFVELAILMIGLAIAVKAMVDSLHDASSLVDEINASNLFTSFLVLAGLLGSLAATSILITKYAPSVAGGAITLLGIGIALKSMMKTFKELVGICAFFVDAGNVQVIDSAINSLLILCGGLGILGFTFGKIGPTAGLSLLGMMFSLKMLDEVFTTIINSEALTTRNLFEHIEEIGTAILLIIGVFKLTTFAGPNALGAAATIVAIGVAARLLTGTLELLGAVFSKVSPNAILATLGVLAVVFLGLSLVLSTMNNISLKSVAGIVAAGGVISALLFVMTILTTIMTTAASLDPAAFQNAAGVMIILSLVTSIMIASTKYAEGVKSGVILGVLGILLTVFATILLFPKDLGGIIRAGLAIAGLIFVFAAVSSVLKSAQGLVKAGSTKKIFATLGTLILDIVAIAGSILLLSKFGGDWKNVAVSAAALAGILKLFASIVEKAGKVKVKKAVFQEIASLVTDLVVVAIALAVLSNFDMGAIFLSALAVGLVMGAIVGVVAIASKIKAKKTVIDEVASLAKSLCLVALALTPLAHWGNDWKSILSSAAALSGIMIALAYAVRIAGKAKANKSAVQEMMSLVKGVCAIALALIPLAHWGNAGAILTAAITLSGIMIALAEAVKIAGTAKANKRAINEMLWLAGAVAVLAVALTPLAHYGQWGNILAATVPLAGVMLALSVVATVAGSVTVNPGAILEIVALAAAVAVLAVALTPLASLGNWASILATAFGLSLIMVALAGVAFAAGLVIVNPVAIAEILALAVGVCAIAVALVPLASLPVEQIKAAAIAVGALMAELAAVAVIMGLLSGLAIAAVPGIIEVIVLAAGMCAIALALVPLTELPIDAIKTAAIAIGGLMAELAIVVAVMGLVGGLAIAAIPGLIEIMVLAAGMCAIALALVPLASLPVEQIKAAAIAVGALIALLGVLSVVLGATAFASGAGALVLIGLAVGMVIFAGAVYIFSLAAQNFANAVVTLYNSGITLAPLCESVLGAIGGLASGLFGHVFTIGEAIGSIITTVQTGISNAKTTISTAIGNIFNLEGMANPVDSLMTLMNPAIAYLTGTGEGTLLGSILSLPEKISTGLSNIGSALTGVPEQIASAIMGDGQNTGIAALPGKLAEAGVDAISGLGNGMIHGASLITDAVDTVIGKHDGGGAFWGAFDAATGYGSDWLETLKAGFFADTGLANGLLSGLSTVINAATALGQQVVSSASNVVIPGLTQLGAQANGILSNIGAQIAAAKEQGGWGGVVEWGMDKAKEKIDDVKNQVKEVAQSFMPDPSMFDTGGGGGGGGGGGKSAKEAAEDAARHEKAVKYQAQAVEEFIKTYGECLGLMEGTDEATDVATSAIEDLARTFGLSEDEIADTESDIESLFMDMFDTIHDAVDGSMKLFDRFSSEASIAPETMLRNMRSNFTGISEWSQEVQMLAAKGFSRGLVEELVKEGPASQGKVRTFLRMTFGQMMEANDLYAKKSEATAEATVKAITAIAFAGKTQDQLIKLANDSTGSLESKAAKAALNAANHMQKVLVTYRELRDTIETTVEESIDLFSEFDMKTETSADQMLKNMQSQLTGVRDWANGLDVLAQRGIDEGLLLKLKDLGPKGYDQVNAFVQMTEEQLQQANQYYQESLVLPSQVSQQVSSSYLNTGISVAQSMLGGVEQGVIQGEEQAVSALQQTAQNVATRVQTAITEGTIDAKGVGATMDTEVANGELENAETTVVPASEEIVAEGAAAAEEVATDAMSDAGYNMVAGMVSAMLSDESLASVRSAAVSLARAANGAFTTEEDINSPSKVWDGFGQYMVRGLTQGMYDQAALASDAATFLATNANAALQQALNQMNADDMGGLQPTITPVLDLTDVQNGMGMMNGMLSSQTYSVNGIANIDPASIMNQSFGLLNDAINRLSMVQAQPSIGDINVTVNAQGIDDPDLLADVVAQRIYSEILSREAVIF